MGTIKLSSHVILNMSPGIWMWLIGVPIMPCMFLSACGLYTYVSVWRYLVLLEWPGCGELVFFVPTERKTDNDNRRTLPITIPFADACGETKWKGKSDKEVWHKVAVGNIQRIGCFSKMIQHEHLAEELISFLVSNPIFPCIITFLYCKFKAGL